jgi:hypothetical protein
LGADIGLAEFSERAPLVVPEKSQLSILSRGPKIGVHFNHHREKKRDDRHHRDKRIKQPSQRSIKTCGLRTEVHKRPNNKNKHRNKGKTAQSA